MALAVLLRDPEETPVALSRRPSAAGPAGRAPPPAALGQSRSPLLSPGPLAEVVRACAPVG